MDEQPTCGKGLAEHSALPAKLGELVAATAEILDLHGKALDLTDENARREHDAYVKLVQQHRSIAGQLQATAERMASYRDLPMGRHDERAMADAKNVDAFVKFVAIEQEVLELLQNAIKRNQGMLAEMRGQGA